MTENKLIVIGGPTASGKTDLALLVAKKFNGEIINADSMQVYKHMNIGTNKEIPEDVASWLFDIVDPDYNFTVAEYQKLALQKIEDVLKRGKLPILVGGTGLYIDAVIKNYHLNANPDMIRRSELSKMDVFALQEELKKLGFDLSSINNSDRNNPRRLIRLIEKQDAGVSQNNMNLQNIDQSITDEKSSQKRFDILFLYPEYNKVELETRIRSRVKKMLLNGFINEVKELLAMGYSTENKSMQSTGYKQVVDFLEGRIKTEIELEEKIYHAHRQYAKRQITWFEGTGRGYDLVRVNSSTIENAVKKFVSSV